MDLDQYLERYYEKFGEGFPMYQLARGREDSEIIDIIKKCLEAGKDAYELGLIDEEVIY